MEFVDELSGMRPLNQNDIEIIRGGILMPVGLDTTMFNDVRDNLIGQYQSRILGVESDPLIKEILHRREVDHEAYLNAIQLKLTKETRDINNYPSTRTKTLPKYYKMIEIESIIQENIDAITEEIMVMFDIQGHKVDQQMIERYVEAIDSERVKNQKPKLTQQEIEFLTRHLFNNVYIKIDIIDCTSAIMADSLRTYDFEVTSIECGSPGVKDAPFFAEIIDSIRKDCTGEQKLSQEHIKTIMSQIDFRNKYKGDRPNITMDPRVAEGYNERVKADLAIQLSQVRIVPERADRLVELIIQRFESAIALPGKWVGNAMASAYGEASTQQTLNTFHSAGDRAGRKNLDQFGAFDAILRANENPQGSMITVFASERWGPEQLKVRIPNMQMTTMSDLILGHRIIDAVDPIPRWEMVSDIINGIRSDITYTGKESRLGINRYSDKFHIRQEVDPETDEIMDVSDGRILEIKFDSKELFFRRISMSQIADAIENVSSLYRVVTSSLEVGLVRVFYKFTDITTLYSAKGVAPAFATDDGFRFALTNLIYPKINRLQVGGIYGVDYVGISKYQINKAINFAKTYMETDTEHKIVRVRFDVQQCKLWAITDPVVDHFMKMKLRRFTPNDYDIMGSYDHESRVYAFRSAGLRMYDYEKKIYTPLTIKVVQEILMVTEKIPLFELLQSTTINPAEIGRPTRMIEFNKQMLSDLGIELPKIYTLIEAIFEPHFKVESSQDTGEERTRGSHFNPDETKIYIHGVDRFKSSDYYAEKQPDFESWLLFQLSNLRISSSTIDEAVLRWYYSIDGTNLQEVLIHPDVDPIYTRSSNIVETYKVLGSEPSRAVAFYEIGQTTDSKLNPIHVDLLASALTYRTPGDKPLSQDTHGMAKRNADFVSRMFERTTEVLMESALGYVDNIQSFPSKIIVGQLEGQGQLTQEERRVAMMDRDIFKFDFWREPEVILPDENVYQPDPNAGDIIVAKKGRGALPTSLTSAPTGPQNILNSLLPQQTAEVVAPTRPSLAGRPSLGARPSLQPVTIPIQTPPQPNARVRPDSARVEDI